MDTNGAESERAAIVAELARVKALFQLRTIAAVIGAPMPVIERGDHIKESGND